MERFSVLMSIYHKEKPEFLRLALDSILKEQTVKPDEIVMVKDGALTDELDEILNEYDKEYPNIFRFITLEKNMGLGYALQQGIKSCSYDLIVRMDTDDISVKTRFEKQIKFMKEHEDVAAVGGFIMEFQESITEETMRLKQIPCQHDEIVKYAKLRSPMNHVTVCFRKKDVIDVGGYQPLLYLEDYFLWVRMIAANKKMANIPENLCYVRIGNGFIQRRGSKKILPSWKKLQKYMQQNHIINKVQRFRNVVLMYIMIYIPDSLRNVIYNKILRSKKERNN